MKSMRWFAVALLFFCLSRHAQAFQEDVPAITDSTGQATASNEPSRFSGNGNVGLDYWHFYKSYYRSIPSSSLSSVFVDYTLNYAFKNGKTRLIAQPFGRLDFLDQSRTHLDFRQLYVVYTDKSLEFTAGIQSLSWGNMLGTSLVNIINQNDEQEGMLENAYLGQPMVSVGFNKGNHSIKVFAIPYFRRKVFPTMDSRLAIFPIELQNTDSRESQARQVDWAIRGQTVLFNDLEIGLSGFYGMNRFPQIQPTPDFSRLVMSYAKIWQESIDMQYVWKSLIMKSEAFWRQQDGKNYYGLSGGLEYPFSNIANSGLELNLYAEYSYDDWKAAHHYPLAELLLAGARLDFSDLKSTRINIKSLNAVDSPVRLLLIDCSRNLGWWDLQAKVHAGWYLGKTLPPTDPLHNLQYIQLFGAQLIKSL